MADDTMVVASNNAGKLREIEAILSELGPIPLRTPGGGSELRPLRVLAPAAVEPRVSGAAPPDPVEDGTTYLANATIKAEAFARWSGHWALADDSGLEIDALDGRPGLHSARYAGANCTSADNIDKVLEELRDVDREARTARFYCCLVIGSADDVICSVEGVCEGTLLESTRGAEGFGYDPIFVPAGGDGLLSECDKIQKFW